jgi:hypothetical protein
MPLRLATPKILSSSMDTLQKVGKTNSMVEEPITSIVFRQHFPETFLWFHISDLGYLTVNFFSTCLGFSSFFFFFASSPRDSFRVKYAGRVVPDEALLSLESWFSFFSERKMFLVKVDGCVFF